MINVDSSLVVVTVGIIYQVVVLYSLLLLSGLISRGVFHDNNR